jgi:hypothetical protein
MPLLLMGWPEEWPSASGHQLMLVVQAKSHKATANK